MISLFHRVVIIHLWSKKTEPDISEEEARTKTLAYMSTMPAWVDHPQLKRERG